MYSIWELLELSDPEGVMADATSFNFQKQSRIYFMNIDQSEKKGSEKLAWYDINGFG